MPPAGRDTFLVYDLYCLTDEIDDHPKTVQRVFFPANTRCSVELVQVSYGVLEIC